jgi:RimJ/RimL family protein N-acetyltransferase
VPTLHLPDSLRGDIAPAGPASSAALRTSRLDLRTYTLDDAPDVWAAIRESRASLLQWVPDIGRRQSLDDVRRGLALLASPRGQARRLIFAIWDSTSTEFLGEVGIYELDRAAGRAEVGYWLRSSARGHGYATESLRALLDCSRAELDITRFEAHIGSGNVASIGVVERLGFCLESRRAASPRWDGEVDSVLVYASGQSVPRTDCSQLGLRNRTLPRR